MGTNRARNIGCVVGLVALLLTLGCGQKASETVAEKAIESAMSADGQKVDVKLDSSGGGFSMSVKGEDGATQQMTVTSSGDEDNLTMTVQGQDGPMSMVAGEAATLPADFPKDVPLLPGMKLTMVQSMPTQKAYVAQGTTDKAMAAVAAFYKEQAAAQGWTERMAMNQAGMHMLNYEKSGRALSVMLNQDGAHTVIQLTTAAK